MRIGPSARAFVRLGVVLLLVAAAAGIWEMLAMQAPGSPWHAGVLPGPIATLRTTATTIALVLFAFAWLMPWAAARGEPRVLVIAIHAGAAILIASLAYGATTGMYGVQIDDLRAGSRWLFRVRALGTLILLGCLLDFARRLLLRAPPAPPAA
jgi:hypothetical protein